MWEPLVQWAGKYTIHQDMFVSWLTVLSALTGYVHIVLSRHLHCSPPSHILTCTAPPGADCADDHDGVEEGWMRASWLLYQNST